MQISLTEILDQMRLRSQSEFEKGEYFENLVRFFLENDNRYANETVGNPAYLLELFHRVITVSLETMKIVNGVPALEID